MSARSFALPARTVSPVAALVAVPAAVDISRLASASLASLTHQGEQAKQGRLGRSGYPCAGNRQPNAFDADFDAIVGANFGFTPEVCAESLVEGDVRGEGWYPSHATDAAEAVAEVTVT